MNMKRWTKSTDSNTTTNKEHGSDTNRGSSAYIKHILWMQFESAPVSSKATVSKTYSLSITILTSVYHFWKSILSIVFIKVSLKEQVERVYSVEQVYFPFSLTQIYENF